ncbi:MAG: signal peptide peptidase SppA [Planctomycetota bacterium]|nr:signal peptide peptidase SppA [Planctomycetota bacterium]
MSDGSWTPGSPSGPGAGPAAASPLPAPPRRGSRVVTVLGTILLVLSIGVNAVLLLVVLGLVGMLGSELTGGTVEETLLERTVARGPSGTKIAVVRVQGIIEDTLVERVRRQLDRARRDDDVVAVILRIDSPGGYLTASDTLYHHVQVFAEESGKPVVAAMDGVAASGGYYAACAAETIVAQRTTVTGSIGIIAQYFFLSGLMEDKLGIQSVTLKRGRQKDWPNLFAADMTPEQRDYIMEAMLDPGYAQFVDVVAEARGMDRGDVLALATGRIFIGPEARENGLVDEIGYFGRAIEIATEKAGVAEAKVVEYVRPFGFMEIFGLTAKAKSLLDLRPETLAGLASPRVMYLWTGR